MTKLTPDQEKKFNEMIAAQVSIVADKFNASIGAIEATIKELQSIIKKKDEELKKKDAKIAELLAQINTASKASASSANTGSIRAPLNSELVAASVVEMSEIKKREANVVIFGLPATEDGVTDEQRVDSLFCEMAVKPVIKQLRRFKIAGQVNTPLLVQLESVNSRNSVLAAAKKLRNNSGYQKVFIHYDATPTQRDNDKRLRLECRSMNEKKFADETQKDQPFRYAIRSGRVIEVHGTAWHPDFWKR
jgi:RNase H-fold protein (predicted Holliday junction resolvase)